MHDIYQNVQSNEYAKKKMYCKEMTHKNMLNEWKLHTLLCNFKSCITSKLIQNI